jgi:hypothetical protein
MLLHFLVLITINFCCLYGMEQEPKITDLPRDVLGTIFEFASEESTFYNNDQKVASKVGIIEKMTPMMRVCKKFKEVGEKRISKHLEEAEHILETMGGKDKVLHDVATKEIPNDPTPDNLVKVCCKLGCDINSTQYENGETLLTRAIKKKDIKGISTLLCRGASEDCPNDSGQMPVALAKEILNPRVNTSLIFGVNPSPCSDAEFESALKQYHEDVQREKQEREAIFKEIRESNNPKMDPTKNDEPKPDNGPRTELHNTHFNSYPWFALLTAGAMIAGGCISYLAYKKWQKNKKQKKMHHIKRSL